MKIKSMMTALKAEMIGGPKDGAVIPVQRHTPPRSLDFPQKVADDLLVHGYQHRCYLKRQVQTEDGAAEEHLLYIYEGTRRIIKPSVN